MEGTRKEEEEQQEGSKQLYERNILERAEGPFWDLSLRTCLSDDGDGGAAMPKCVGESMCSVLQEEGAGVEIWEWKFGATKHLVCCYLGKASLSFCWDWVKYGFY